MNPPAKMGMMAPRVKAMQLTIAACGAMCAKRRS